MYGESINANTFSLSDLLKVSVKVTQIMKAYMS